MAFTYEIDVQESELLKEIFLEHLTRDVIHAFNQKKFCGERDSLFVSKTSNTKEWFDKL